MKSWLTGLVVVSALGAGAYYWFGRGDAAQAVPVYRTTKVGRAELVQSVSATGQLSPLTTVEVGSQVSGRIAKIYVDFNDPVKDGQLLAEIEPDTYKARMVQAQAQVDSARANYDLKKVTADRSSELRKNNLVAQSDYDQAMAELRQQEAAVRIAEASLENAKLDVDRCKIYSPIDGVVISRDIDVGQTVQASFSAPKLFSIAQDMRQMEISAAVSEADIGGVESNQDVSFSVDAFPDRKFKGSVRQVRANSTITQNVVTYPTIISVDNEDGKLLPGMTATVEIITARRNGILQVPNAALRFKPPENAVVRAAAVATADGASAAEGLTIDQIPELAQVPAEYRQRAFDRHDLDKNGRLDPTELAAMKKQMEEFRARMAAGGGGGPGGGRGPGGGGGGNGGGGRQRANRPPPDVTRTVYLLAEKPADGKPAIGDLISKTVKIGITDGANTEIISGLDEGDLVVVGLLDSSSAEAVAAQPRNPFMPQFGRRR